MSEWKPGDAAMVPGVGVALRSDDGKWITPDRDADSRYLGVRPLAVIDFEDREQVERLVDILHEAPWFDGQINKPTHTSVLQAALREFAKPTPPKPDEPTGLGAVVRDRIGHTWTRTHRPSSVIEGGRKPWTAEIDTGFDSDYADIDVVKVLSEGIS